MPSRTRPGPPRMWAYAAMLLLISSMSLRRPSILCLAVLSGSRDDTCLASVGHELSNALSGAGIPPKCPVPFKAVPLPGLRAELQLSRGSCLGWAAPSRAGTPRMLSWSLPLPPPSILLNQDGYGSSWTQLQADLWHRARLSVMGWGTGQSRKRARAGSQLPQLPMLVCTHVCSTHTLEAVS